MNVHASHVLHKPGTAEFDSVSGTRPGTQLQLRTWLGTTMSYQYRVLLLLGACSCAGSYHEEAVGPANACRVALPGVDISGWREVAIPAFRFCVPPGFRRYLPNNRLDDVQGGGWAGPNDQVQWAVGPFKNSDPSQEYQPRWAPTDTIAGLPVGVEERRSSDGYSLRATRLGLILSMQGSMNGSLGTARVINRTVRPAGGA